MPLKGTTKLANLKKAVKNTLRQFSLSIVNISGIVTDGALAMVGKREGLVKLIEDDALVAQNSRLMKYHWIVDQENLYGKFKTVNLIRAKGLNHRQFQDFLKSLDADYDIIYFTEVRWLSPGQTLKRFYDLLNEIKCYQKKNVLQNLKMRTGLKI